MLRGKQRIPVVVSRVITPGLERGQTRGQTGAVPSVNSYDPSTLFFLGAISHVTHPDFGTSIQPGPGSVFVINVLSLSLSPMNGRVVRLQRISDRDLESFASDTIASAARRGEHTCIWTCSMILHRCLSGS